MSREEVKGLLSTKELLNNSTAAQKPNALVVNPTVPKPILARLFLVS